MSKQNPLDLAAKLAALLATPRRSVECEYCGCHMDAAHIINGRVDPETGYADSLVWCGCEEGEDEM